MIPKPLSSSILGPFSQFSQYISWTHSFALKEGYLTHQGQATGSSNLAKEDETLLGSRGCINEGQQIYQNSLRNKMTFFSF